MDMRKSRVLAKMRAGKVATCVKLNLTDARVAEIAAMCGRSPGTVKSQLARGREKLGRLLADSDAPSKGELV